MVPEDGIYVADTASLIYSLKDVYPFDLLLQGGVQTTLAERRQFPLSLRKLIAEHEFIPPFKFTNTPPVQVSGANRELVDLLNVFAPPPDCQTPKVSCSSLVR
jgi:alginate O-acetyltransferase complex protein AlgJ